MPFQHREDLFAARETASDVDSVVVLVLLVDERLEREPVQPREDSPPGLALEVHPAADGAVVLAARLLQVDASHLAGGKVDVADVGNTA